MSCCLNPECQNPLNLEDATHCRSCATPLESLLRGRYRVLQPIGHGGFGRTYLMVDEDRLKARCVLKQFLPQVKGTGSHRQANLDKAIQLFNQEAVRLHDLGEHPQIPALLAYFEQGNQLYLVQQFVEGPTLLRELHQRGPFGEEQVEAVLLDLLPVLEFVHSQQVVHRDIKPTNVIRRRSDRRLVLIDFGLAKQLSVTDSAQTGTKLGTEGYSPIEQLRSGKAFPASDLYSLGVTCLHLLTGIKPDELYDPMRGWIWKERLAERGLGVSDRLEHVLMKLTQDLVSNRYQSAAEVLQDLKKPAVPVAAVPSPSPRPAPTPTPAILATPRRSPAAVPTSPPTSGPPRSRATKPALTWSCVGTLLGHASWITALAISPDGQVLVSGGLDDTLRLWSLRTGKQLQLLTGHTKPINTLVISPDNQFLLSGSDDDTIKCWDLLTGNLLGTLTGHMRDVNALAISADSKWLVSGSEDRSLKLWRLPTGELVKTLVGGQSMIKAIALSPSGRLVASAGLDNKISLWDLQTSKMLTVLTGHYNSVNTVAISPNGQVLASGSKDRTVRLWELPSGKPLHTLSAHLRDINAIAFTPDGHALATASSDETVKLWRLDNNTLLGTLSGHAGAVNALAFSADGHLLATGSWDKTIKIWRLTFG